MTKGRPATRGIDDAVVIARKRGCVMRIAYGLDSTCDFLIRTVAYIVFAKIRRMDRITATASGIGHEFRDIIGELRLFPKSKEILLELWIYSKHGTYRFFRIMEYGLVEIGGDGGPVPVPAPAEFPAGGPFAGGTAAAGPIAGEPVTAVTTGSDSKAGTGGEGGTGETSGQGSGVDPGDTENEGSTLPPPLLFTTENPRGVGRSARNTPAPRDKYPSKEGQNIPKPPPAGPGIRRYFPGSVKSANTLNQGQERLPGRAAEQPREWGRVPDPDRKPGVCP